MPKPQFKMVRKKGKDGKFHLVPQRVKAGNAPRKKGSGGGSRHRSSHGSGHRAPTRARRTRLGRQVSRLSSATARLAMAAGVSNPIIGLATGRTYLHPLGGLNLPLTAPDPRPVINPFTGTITQSRQALGDVWGSITGTQPQFAGHPGTFQGNLQQAGAFVVYNFRRAFTAGTRAALFGPTVAGFAAMAFDTIATPFIVDTLDNVAGLLPRPRRAR